MATVIRKKNRLRQTYRKLGIGAAHCFGVTVLSLALFFTVFLGLRRPSWLDFVLVGLMAVSGMAGTLLSGKRQVLRAGLDGEEEGLAVVRALPKDYRCYQNVTLSYGGKTVELDLVITGPTGVFIAEVKNQKGTVSGSADAAYWMQHKVGRRGGQYSKRFYSPVKQVGTHTWCLANWLRSRGLHTHISSMVYFSNPETVLHLKGDMQGVSVFAASCDGGQALRNAITKNSGHVPAKLLKEINRKLDRL